MSEPEYDIFDGMGLSDQVYDSQRQAWIDWNQAMDHLAGIWMEEIAEWEPYREATRAWANLGLRPTEHPDLYRVALVHAGPYRAPDVEPDWRPERMRFDVSGPQISVAVQRDGIWLNRRDARDYDAMMTSIREAHEWRDSFPLDS